MSWPQWPQPTGAVAGWTGTGLASTAPAVGALQTPGTPYTPEQWAAMQQQNWQQWIQWQQQYQQWQQQYGEQYQKSLALSGQTTPGLPIMPVQPPLPAPDSKSAPPLPLDSRPPLPPEEPPVVTTANYTANIQLNVPPPTQVDSNFGGQNYGQNTQLPPLLSLPVSKPFIDNQQPRIQTFRNEYSNKRPGEFSNERFEEAKKNRWEETSPDKQESKQWNSNQTQQRNQQWNGNKIPAHRPNVEELSEAEKNFDKQFEQWEAQFNKWKEQNAGHPDKQQYKEYEAKWESWRAQLLERREQMRKKRLGLHGSPAQSSTKLSVSSVPSTGTINPPVGVVVSQSTKTDLENQDVSKKLVTVSESEKNIETSLDNKNKSNTSDNDISILFSQPPKEQRTNIRRRRSSVKSNSENITDSSFLKPSILSEGGIPGLDLVKQDDNKSNNTDEVCDTKVDSQLPDFEAISKGINSILGDEKFLSMLSMVAQNKKIESFQADSQSIIKSNMMQDDYHNNHQANDFRGNESFSVAQFNTQRDRHLPASNNFHNYRPTLSPNNFNQNSLTRNEPNFNRDVSNMECNEFNKSDRNDHTQFNDFGTFNREFNNQCLSQNFNRGTNNQGSQGQGPYLQRNSEENSHLPLNRVTDFNKKPHHLVTAQNDRNYGDIVNRSINNVRIGPSSQQNEFQNSLNQEKLNREANFNQGSINRIPMQMNECSSRDLQHSILNRRQVDYKYGQNITHNIEQNDFNSINRIQRQLNRGSGDFNVGHSNRGSGDFNHGSDKSLLNRDLEDFNRRSIDFNSAVGNRSSGDFKQLPSNSDLNDFNYDLENRRTKDFNQTSNKDVGYNRFPSNKSVADLAQGSLNRNSNDFKQGVPQGFNDFNIGSNRGPNDFYRRLSNRRSNDFNQGSINRDVTGFNQVPQNRAGDFIQAQHDRSQIMINDMKQGSLYYETNNLNQGPPNHLSTSRCQPTDELNNDGIVNKPICDEWNPHTKTEDFSKHTENIRNSNRIQPKELELRDHFNQNLQNFDNCRELSNNCTGKWNVDQFVDDKPYTDNYPHSNSNIRRQNPDQFYKGSNEKYWDEALILKPVTVIDYCHKSLNKLDTNFIEPVQTFDYGHTSKSTDTKINETLRDLPPRFQKFCNSNYKVSRDPPKPPKISIGSNVDEFSRKSYDNQRLQERFQHTFKNKRTFEDDKTQYEDIDDYEDDTFDEYEIRKRSKDRELESFLNKPNPIFEVNNKSSVTMIEDILVAPGRNLRPPRIAIILRGPPGSGKTFLAKLIKDKEVEQGGSAPRILALDDYFMIEQDNEVFDKESGRKTVVKEMVYEYEECMELAYRQSLEKAFKKTITDGFFPFIILDCVNDKIKHFSDMWSFAKQNGFQVYICQMELDVTACTKRNIHHRSEIEIERLVAGWEHTPAHYLTLDATSLIQSGCISEVEMEEVPELVDEEKDDDNIEGHVISKWERMEPSGDKLARLDGISKPLRPRATMEDYLQLDVIPENKPGEKRVRWADLEEKRRQEKMRAIGFVVGQTDWDRMMDPTQGSSALTQTKYIERVRRF